MNILSMKPKFLLPVLVSMLSLGASPVRGFYDIGYDHLPKARIDVNKDGRIDFCRFVGDAPNIFIACDIGGRSQYGYQSIKGIDQGYPNFYRGFQDKNGDGYGDYCRYVGNHPKRFLSCNLGRRSGFDKNQYTVNYK